MDDPRLANVRVQNNPMDFGQAPKTLLDPGCRHVQSLGQLGVVEAGTRLNEVPN
jgi:hypothetical protein